MKTKRSPSPERQKIAKKFGKTTADAARIRYGTMRKVDFSNWKDIGRFAQYAQDHLEVAKSAYSQLEYWESLYQIVTQGNLREFPRGITPKQQTQLEDLQKEIEELPANERFALGKSIEFRHRDTLDLLHKMTKEGLLSPAETVGQRPLKETEGKRPTPPPLWAVAYDQNHLPIIEGGQLKLYQTKAPPAGKELLRALDEAAKFKADHGMPGKLGFFIGYAGGMTLNFLQRRPYLNSLTEKEAKSIQSTNEMIQFLQKEWKATPPPPMKNIPEKNPLTRSDETDSKAEHSHVEYPPVSPLQPTTTPYSAPSIVNHITIQGSMTGDIGFQRNEASPEGTDRKPFPDKYPQQNGHQAERKRKIGANSREI